MVLNEDLRMEDENVFQQMENTSRLHEIKIIHV
jgi:hypothetical protein